MWWSLGSIVSLFLWLVFLIDSETRAALALIARTLWGSADRELKGKGSLSWNEGDICIVTGASEGGLGHATAARFAAEGLTVFACFKGTGNVPEDEERVKEHNVASIFSHATKLAVKLREGGAKRSLGGKHPIGDVVGFCVDLSDGASIRAFVEDVRRECKNRSQSGGVALLINNAACFPGNDGTAAHERTREWGKRGSRPATPATPLFANDEFMVVNAFAPFYLAQLLQPLLRPCGIVVNIGSFTHRAVRRRDFESFLLGEPCGSPRRRSPPERYMYSKLALVMLSGLQNRAWVYSGMRCAVADPGALDSNLMRHWPWQLRLLGLWGMRTLRLITPMDLAVNSVVAAASSSGGYLYGSSMCVLKPSSLSQDEKLARTISEVAACAFPSVKPGQMT